MVYEYESHPALEMTKNLEGDSHIHIPLRFFEITGLFRDQQPKKNMLQTIFTVTRESFDCIIVLVTRREQRENDVISKQ